MDRLTRIRAFIHVVETGSFSTASERLGLSRAAVSKYVSQLEDFLGGRLLNRTTRHVSPTESGRIYYERCREILQNLEEADGLVSGLSGQPKGTLRVTCPTYFASRHLLPLIEKFNQLYPDLKVEIMCTERIVDLVDEGYDLAIRMTKAPDQGLIARRLARCRHIVVASPAYLAKNPVPQVPQDLPQHRCVVFSYHTTSIWPFTKDDGDYSVKVSAALKTNNPDILLESTILGMGITLMPTFLASDAILEGKLRLVLREYQTIDLDIYAVYASRHYLPVKIRVFVDFLKEQITDPPYWDACLGSTI